VQIPWAAQQRVRELDAVFARARQQSDLQVQSDYAKYLVVRVSGLIEDVVTTIVLVYVEQTASPHTARHVQWRMKLFQNPTLERIAQLLGSFRPTWRTQLLAEVTDPEREALRSVHDSRNEVAHGGQSSISLGQVDQYYTDVKKLLDKVANIFA
jgi:hypothetical protein